MLRLVVAEDVLPEERLVVLPVERLVRSFWVTVPAERVEEEPVLRLVVAEDVLPEERLVVLPVERLVLVEDPRLVRSFCAKEERLEVALTERLAEGAAERVLIVAPAERVLAEAERELIAAPDERLAETAPEDRLVETEPDERLIEEDPRVVVWEEDDRAAEDPPERRDWASASGAATITKVRRTAAKVLIILFMALVF